MKLIADLLIIVNLQMPTSLFYRWNTVVIY